MNNNTEDYVIAVKVLGKYFDNGPELWYLSEKGHNNEFGWFSSLEHVITFKSQADAISFYEQNKEDITRIKNSFDIIEVTVRQPATTYVIE